MTEPGHVERRLQSLQETVNQLKLRLQEVQREPEGMWSVRSAEPTGPQTSRRLEARMEALHREVEEIRREKAEVERELGRLRGVERELIKVTRENEDLKAAKDKLETETHRKTAEIEVLIKENEELQLQLQQQSIDRADETELQLKARISELEQELYSAQTGPEAVRSLQHSLAEKQLIIDGLSRPADSRQLERLAERLGVEEGELEAAVEDMLKEMKYRRAAALTLERVGQLMVDCGMSAERPTIKEIWRWVRRLTEQYMNVTQHYRNLSALLTELCELLGVQLPKDLKPRVLALLNRPDMSDFLVSADD